MRFIGIRHRVKRTAEGEARPTQVVVIEEGGEVMKYDLATEVDELDFLYGKFPVAYREATTEDDLKAFPPHQVLERKKPNSEEKTIRVPCEYEGYQPDDVVLMVLGGSGDRFAYALSRRGEEIGASVYRIPGHVLADRRNGASKDDDAITLVKLYGSEPGIFEKVGPRDRELIRTSEAFRARKEAMQARIACQQRLRQRFIGTIFLSDEGMYPEGDIEAAYDELKANDKVLAALEKEEASREYELKQEVHRLAVWREVFAYIKGVGEVIAAGIIVAVGDIRRFSTDAKLKAFLGVHVLADGRFPRRRGGEVANWNPCGRQALYLLGDQFNRRKDTRWGAMLLHYKETFREKHPEEVCENGKRRYTRGHIHKMASWRTLTKFVEFLHKEWRRVEAAEQK
jgi:hypothetical protein